MTDRWYEKAMKTTLYIDDALYRKAKILAVNEGCTVSYLVERGLKQVLNPAAREDGKTVPPKLPLIRGGHRARAGKELTPDRVAALLLDQETSWALERP